MNKKSQKKFLSRESPFFGDFNVREEFLAFAPLITVAIGTKAFVVGETLIAYRTAKKDGK